MALLPDTAPLDPDTRTILDQMALLAIPDFSEMEAPAVRELFDRTAALMGRSGAPVEGVTGEDRTVPGPAGPIPVRLYRPEVPGPRPAVAYFHGGGWVIGGIETHDSSCRQLCARTGALVCSVGYRLAPEDRFPAAVDDCHAVTTWLAASADELGLKPGRLVVAGDSAGGNLAALVALRARSAGPDLVGQVLVYPATDLTLAQPSVQENGADYLLTERSMEWFVDHWLAGHDPKDPEVSPLFADLHLPLPPAVVATAGYDPLRDEGLAYAKRLEAAGVAVTRLHFPDLIHGFLGFGTFSASSARAAGAVWDACAALLDG